MIGWIRQDGTGGASQVSDLATRAVSTRGARAVLDYPLYGGFLDLQRQSPPPAHALAAAELPDDTSEGPHFFYGLQWWFFGALAVFGFGYLAYDEWRRPRADDATSGGQPELSGARSSERAEHPTVDRKHRTGDEGRPRAEQEQRSRGELLRLP